MVTSLDPKTARKFVTGTLKEEDKRFLEKKAEIEEYNANLAKANLKSHSVSGKLSFLRKEAEASIREAYGETILCSNWESRTWCVYVLEPQIVSDEARPVYGRLVQFSYNLRSRHTTNAYMAEISTHFMERLLARRADTNLLALLKEEVPLEVLLAYHKELWVWSNGGCKEYSYKLKTANGTACIVFPKAGGLPVFTTWYP